MQIAINQIHAERAVAHLEPHSWRKANRHLVKKAISEFVHELLITPQKMTDNDWYKIVADDAQTEYHFVAGRFQLDHWHIEIDSLRKYKEGQEAPIDALYFITEFQQQLGIPKEFQATYLEEISSTLLSSVYKAQYQKFTAQELAEANFQEVEQAMTEGHPCFVANNGRMGFNTEEYQQYAPEVHAPFQLIWLAGHRSRATYTGVSDLSYEQLLLQELGAMQIAQFTEKLRYLGLEPEEYVFIPVHPWQWKNKLVNLFAADIANYKLIYLGQGEDQYVAQQSIRTLYNLSSPEKHYTKTALGITNMGFMRGLSPYYMTGTPHITEWITNLLEKDKYLQKCGFEMLDEVATVGYRNVYYETLGTSYPQNKMLAALWRQSPVQKIQARQKVMTMAAFLHVDKMGQALLPLLIQASGRSVKDWLRAYLKCYLSPLIHCFYEYGLAFMPHGENLIMVLEDNIPVKALMKDITEEVLVYNPDLELPEKVQRLYAEATDEMQLLSLLTDVFDSIFRFVAVILDTQTDYHEELFWEQVAECILQYQEEHPEHQAKYERYDLFVPTFKRVCLNRLQLSNHRHMLNLADPINSLKLASTLDNPLARFKPN